MARGPEDVKVVGLPGERFQLGQHLVEPRGVLAGRSALVAFAAGVR
jgi:hypothetical protein